MGATQLMWEEGRAGVTQLRTFCAARHQPYLPVPLLTMNTV